MKWLGVFPIPPGWDASPLQGYPPALSLSWPIYWVERGTVRVKNLVQENNTKSLARAQTWTACSLGVDCTNHEGTTPSIDKLIIITSNHAMLGVVKWSFNIHAPCSLVCFLFTSCLRVLIFWGQHEGLEGRGARGVLIPHSCSFFMRIPHPTQFIITVTISNLVFLSQKNTFKVKWAKK